MKTTDRELRLTITRRDAAGNVKSITDVDLFDDGTPIPYAERLRLTEQLPPTPIEPALVPNERTP